MLIKIEKIVHKKTLYAIIIKQKNQFNKDGVNFITTNKDLFQLGFLKHKKNTRIRSHFHIKKIRKINYLSEVLIIKKGKLKVKFFDKRNMYLKKDKVLERGDVILLLKGGHGFDVLENTEIIEIKQGPYSKQKDKILI